MTKQSLTSSKSGKNKAASSSRDALIEGDANIFGQARALETARTYWQYGAWEKLTSIPADIVSQDADRAKLAGLIAGAYTNLGQEDLARRWAAKAMDWGCDRQILARILISATHNSLATTALALQEPKDAQQHFRAAIDLLEPRADQSLLAKTREIRQAARAGLLPDAVSALDETLLRVQARPEEVNASLGMLRGEMTLLKHELVLNNMLNKSFAPERAKLTERNTERQSAHDARKVNDLEASAASWADASLEVSSNPRFNQYAFTELRNSCSTAKNQGMASVTYLDCKSLPRSGLHFLRNTLSKVIGEGFSFCEWYNEPGCCRKMPCAFIPSGGLSSSLHCRMVKSHDFDIQDPAFPTAENAKRLILLRDPLYILTSWWTLQILQVNSKILKENNINVQKIFYLHEKELLARAHRLVAQHGYFPNEVELHDFLQEKSKYIIDFSNKWTRNDALYGSNYHILRFQDIPNFILDFLRSHDNSLSVEQKTRVDYFEKHMSRGLKIRSNPFSGPSERASEHLSKYAEMFQYFVKEILEKDQTGNLVRASIPQRSASS